MSAHLRDLLPAVEATAPPLRHTADDVLNLGRRRQRHRRTALACGAAVVAVVAITGTVAVLSPSPQIPAAVLFTERPFSGNIAPATVDGLNITETVQVTADHQIAMIIDPANSKGVLDELKPGEQFVAAAGLVTIFRRGVRPAGGDPVSVNGHPGRYVRATAPGRPAVVWEYADDAFAEVRAELSKAQLTAIAEAVRTDVEQPFTVGFKLAGPPPGYELDAAGTIDRSRLVTTEGMSNLRLTKGAASIDVSVRPRWWFTQLARVEDKTFCPSANLCYRPTADRRYLAQASGESGADVGELRSALTGLTFADPEDRTTWFKATDSGA